MPNLAAALGVNLLFLKAETMSEGSKEATAAVLLAGAERASGDEIIVCRGDLAEAVGDGAAILEGVPGTANNIVVSRRAVIDAIKGKTKPARKPAPKE